MADVTKKFTESFQDWKPYNQMIQPNLKDTVNYYTAKTTLIAAGPSALPNDGAPVIKGLGLVESAALTQNLALSTIYEVGSDYQVDIPGRNIPGVTIGRLFTYQPNLLSLLYSYYWAEGSETGKEGTSSTKLANLGADAAPNSSGIWLNLGSLIFKYPFGLMFVFATDAEFEAEETDATINIEGDFYLENCHITGHQLGINAGAVVLMESCAIKPARVVPVDVEI